MKNVSLIYASRKGQTAKIARFMQRALEQAEMNVEIHDVRSENPRVGPQVDGVIIGAPVYAGRFPRAIRKWVRKHQLALRDKKIGLFVVALNTADRHEKARMDDDRLLREFIDWTGLVPDYVTNIAGALQYTHYSPPVRWQLKKIAAAAGGDTDTSRDFEYTDWEKVRSFCDDFRTARAFSPFALQTRFPNEKTYDSLMRVFEQNSFARIDVATSAMEAYRAFTHADSKEMKGASALASVRTLGGGKQPEDSTFANASLEFGVIPLGDTPGREILGGLVGRFWRLDFGIERMSSEAFKTFDAPGFTKVLTRFEFVDTAAGHSQIRASMRIHSTDERASVRFGLYWMLLSIGIRLYMKSVLRGFKRQAEREAGLPALTTHKA